MCFCYIKLFCRRTGIVEHCISISCADSRIGFLDEIEIFLQGHCRSVISNSRLVCIVSCFRNECPCDASISDCLFRHDINHRCKRFSLILNKVLVIDIESHERNVFLCFHLSGEFSFVAFCYLELVDVTTFLHQFPYRVSIFLVSIVNIHYVFIHSKYFLPLAVVPVVDEDRFAVPSSILKLVLVQKHSVTSSVDDSMRVPCLTRVVVSSAVCQEPVPFNVVKVIVSCVAYSSSRHLHISIVSRGDFRSYPSLCEHHRCNE